MIKEGFKEGITKSMEITVEDRMTAASMSSGALEVFATPMMISYMETVSFNCAQEWLEEGWSTVGVAVNITHDAPTPVGRKVRFDCKLEQIDRRKLTFSVVATSDNGTVIGKGMHDRFIIEVDKFMNKMADAYKA